MARPQSSESIEAVRLVVDDRLTLHQASARTGFEIGNLRRILNRRGIAFELGVAGEGSFDRRSVVEPRDRQRARAREMVSLSGAQLWKGNIDLAMALIAAKTPRTKIMRRLSALKNIDFSHNSKGSSS